MNVQISIRHMVASKVIKHMVKDLCREVKNKYGDIQNVDIKIEDINGLYKAGIDKRCHLKVRGRNHLAIDIDDIDEDITCAIDNAFYRLKQKLERDLFHKHRRLDITDVDTDAIYSMQA